MSSLTDIFQSTLFLIKLGLVIGMFVYVGFAVIVLRQVHLMSQTLNVELDRPLNFIAVMHLLASVVVLILCILI